MSANNVYYATKIGKMYYGWDIMAEAWGDHDDDHPIKLHLVHAEIADSVTDLQSKLNDAGIGYAEYGITFQPYLPKDGTPIEVVI